MFQVMVGTATITNLKQYLWMSPEEITRREAEKQARRSAASTVLDRSFMTNGSVIGVGTTGRGTPATLGNSSPTPSAVAPSHIGMSAAPTPAMSVRGLQHPPSVAGTTGTREPSVRGIPTVARGISAMEIPTPSVRGNTLAQSLTVVTPVSSVAGSLPLPQSSMHATPAPSIAASVKSLNVETVPSAFPASSVSNQQASPTNSSSTAYFTSAPSVAGFFKAADNASHAHLQYTASAWEGSLSVSYVSLILHTHVQK